MTEIILAAAALCAVAAAVYQWYERKQMYQTIDRMLDEVLNREQITCPDLREGGVSSLANKALRVQEKLELELHQAEEEKEQVKSLISNLSHQLKTPLSNLMMYREMAEEEGISQERREQFLGKIGQAADKLDWILGSLFKMVRLEQGAIAFEAEPRMLRPTLLEAVNSVYEKAEKKEIEILTEEFSDRALYHNGKWTAEVLENILENAIKYTRKKGRICLRVKHLELYTEIQIEDTGIGIRREELTEIFKRFYRSRDVEKEEGSGIGLYLSRLILEQEKGYLTVRSEVGKGSCFSVFLQNC